MPILDLQATVEESLSTNPVLEVVEQGEAEETEPVKADEEKTPEFDVDDLSGEKTDMDIDRWVEYFSDETSDLGYTAGRTGEEEMPRDNRPGKISLTEYLLEQLEMNAGCVRDQEIGKEIIASINTNGFLTVPLEEIAASVDASVEETEKVLSLIQSFEPSGVGARDIRECLLIQIKVLGWHNSLAEKIVRDHWDEFERKRFPELAEKLGVSVVSIQNAANKIAGLEPKPGRQISREDIHYVIPDVMVEFVDGKYNIRINDDYVPKLRLNASYRKMMGNRKTSPETRQYLEKKIHEAIWLVKGIEQRRRTIHRVTECLIEMQSEFFEKGDAFLKPLTLREVADRIQMHESTVSRVTSNKYIQTPKGVIPFRHFFTAGLSDGQKGVVSAVRAKEEISRLISSENPTNPLADQQIVGMLGSKGIILARRTVAKYREELNIPSVSQRRRY